MVVHHIVNSFSSDCDGAEKIAFQLCDGGQLNGIPSRLVPLEYDGLNCSIDIYPLDLTTTYGIKPFIKVYNYIKNNCADDDIIHAHLFPTMLYVAIAVRMMHWKGTVVCTEHSTHNRRRGSVLGKLIDRQVYPAYNKIFCISSGTKKSLQAWMPDQAEKMMIIENGADIPFEVFISRESREKVVIVSVGRLHKLKNYETAFKALSCLNNVDFEYQIAGIGDEEISLKELCKELGLQDKVTFLGYVQDVPGLLQRADIFLITSLWEGFGLAAVEAMNAGLPVVASDVPGLAEIVDSEHKCGILVNPKEPNEIAAAVMELTDWEKRIQLGRNAFERSLDFSKERMIDGYIKEYKKIFLQPLR